MSEAFLKTNKRDFVRVRAQPDARATLDRIDDRRAVRALQRQPPTFRAPHALAPRVQARPPTRRAIRLDGAAPSLTVPLGPCFSKLKRV
jgi:hypothetical protein